MYMKNLKCQKRQQLNLEVSYSIDPDESVHFEAAQNEPPYQHLHCGVFEISIYYTLNKTVI